MKRQNVYSDSDTDDKLITEIKAFLQAHPPPKLPPDAMLSVEDFRKFGYTPKTLYPAASKSAVVEAEAAIGFPIPNLLKRLYLEVSNGIQGFKYNIVGVQGGSAASAGTLVNTYLDFKAGVEYMGGQWTPGLLPFCDWGCSSCSCVDCTDPAAPIFISEECDVSAERYTLREFFQMWLKGNVRRFQDSEVVTKKITNPFTGKRATVSARKTK